HRLPASEDTRRELERIYDETWTTFSHPELLNDYVERWARFLDLTPDAVQLNLDRVRSLESRTMSHHHEWAGNVLARSGGPTDFLERRDGLGVALAVQTMRTVFNDAVAAALRVPYLATSLRLPI